MSEKIICHGVYRRNRIFNEDDKCYYCCADCEKKNSCNKRNCVKPTWNKPLENCDWYPITEKEYDEIINQFSQEDLEKMRKTEDTIALNTKVFERVNKNKDMRKFS